MRVQVDYDRCEGHGLCEDVAPALFRIDDQGDLVTLFEGEQVPLGHEDGAVQAVRACPVSALRTR